MDILTYADAAHRDAVIALWKTVFGYTSAHNDPGRSLDRKIGHDDLVFVAVDDGAVVGTIMAGYDGHRGWLYSLAVRSDYRRRGVGTALLRHAEARLEALGCDKINLQVVGGNEAARAFYEANDYAVEDRISMGKRVE